MEHDLWWVVQELGFTAEKNLLRDSRQSFLIIWIIWQEMARDSLFEWETMEKIETGHNTTSFEESI